MHSLPNHTFHEAQALLRMSGRFDSMETLLELRAGQTHFISRGGKVSQVSLGNVAAPDIMERLHHLQLVFDNLIQENQHLNPFISGHILVRDRWTEDSNRKSSFAALWGTFKSLPGWDIFFGGKSQGQIQFRHGPWGNWDTSLPHCATFKRKYPIQFSPYCSTLLHEAVGHALEAEYLQDSPLKPKIGMKYCHGDLTLADHPEIPGLAGSMERDDTGQKASETVLIHRGCFVGDLDREKGVWRRSSFKATPMIRTSNAVIQSGDSDPDDWIKYLDDLYVVAWIETGKWLPGTQDIEVLTGPVFRIHKGMPTSFFPNLKLKFKSLDFLKAIQAVGNDSRLDPIVHWCFKNEQGVPMSLISPSLLVENCFFEVESGI